MTAPIIPFSQIICHSAYNLNGKANLLVFQQSLRQHVTTKQHSSTNTKCTLSTMISLRNSTLSRNTEWQVIALLLCHHSSWELAIWNSRQSRQTASNCLSVCLSVCLVAHNQERIARSLLPSDRSAVPSGDGPSTATSPLPHSHVTQALSYFHAEGFQRTKNHQHKQRCTGGWKTTWAMWLGVPQFKCGSRNRLQCSMFFVVSVLVDKRLLDVFRSNRKRPLPRLFQLFSHYHRNFRHYIDGII